MQVLLRWCDSFMYEPYALFNGSIGPYCVQEKKPKATVRGNSRSSTSVDCDDFILVPCSNEFFIIHCF